MKKIISFAIAATVCLSSINANAKNSSDNIKGKVSDKSENAVGYATVAVIDKDGKVLCATSTAEDGTFEMKTDNVDYGEYTLLCSFVGYKEYTVSLSDVIDRMQDGDISLVEIVLENDEEALESAVVTGKRELIEHQFDKIVLNVSELAVAQTGTALDVLKNSPGVTVDKDGNIQLNGASVAVWIDGRPSNMSGKDLEVYLKGNPGNTIEKVELMSSPSAKYDAEGSGGIINIKTRKGFMQGLSGSLSATGGLYFRKNADNVSGGFNGAANLRYKSEKTYTSISYTPYWNTQDAEARETKWYGTDYSSVQRSDTYMDWNGNGHNIRVQEDWNVTDKDVLGAIVNFNTNSSLTTSGDGCSISDFLKYGTPEEELYSKMMSWTDNGEKRNFIQANLNYTRTFNPQKASSLTVNLDYSRNASHEYNAQTNKWDKNPALEDDYGFRENTARVLNLYSFKADYTTLFWKQTGRIEAGAKGAISLTTNKFARYNYDTSSDPWTLEGAPEKTNNFKYREQVYAAYVNVSKQFNPKWNASVGLRGELTLSNGYWDNSAPTKKTYFDVFPNVTLGWMPSQKCILSVNYAYRISRPKYWQLNPFKSYINATTYVKGKPDLLPSYSHNVTLSGVFLSRISVNVGYMRDKNFNDMQMPVFDPDSGMMGMVFENAGIQNMAYVSAGLSEQPITKWWNITVNASYRYTNFKAYKGLGTGLDDNYNNIGHSFFGYGSTTFFLPKSFKLGLSGYYATPQKAGFYDIAPMWTVNFNMSKTFLDGKISLDLYVDDLFNSRCTNLKIYDGTRLAYSIDQNNTFTQVRLGVSWRFGQSVSSSRRNVGNLDESSRM